MKGVLYSCRSMTHIWRKNASLLLLSLWHLELGYSGTDNKTSFTFTTLSTIMIPHTHWQSEKHHSLQYPITAKASLILKPTQTGRGHTLATRSRRADTLSTTHWWSPIITTNETGGQARIPDVAPGSEAWQNLFLQTSLTSWYSTRVYGMTVFV